MKKLKYFAILMMVGLLTLTGCSMGKKLTAKERLEKALINLANADSFTAKLSFDGEIEDEDIAVNFILKAAKDDDYYNLYLALEAESDMFDDDIDVEAYLIGGKKKTDIYLGYDYDWAHVKLDNSDVEGAVNVDVSSYADGVDKDDIKEVIKSFKKVKEGKTKDGITQIIATIDGDDLEVEGFDEDVDVIFYVDKKNNLTGIEIEVPNFEDINVKFEIKKINDTKVKLPKDVKEYADDIDPEDLLYVLLDMVGMGEDEPYDDDDDDDYYSRDYSASDIFEDILLSASIKTCSDEPLVIDFANYNDELLLYDNYYDVKRIEEGEIVVKETDGVCDYEITKQIVVDGKKCTVIDKDYDEGKCE